MPLFFEGYSAARETLLNANLDKCLAAVDSLWGRENIEDITNLEEVRAEALWQQKREFTDTASCEYERQKFWLKVARHSAA